MPTISIGKTIQGQQRHGMHTLTIQCSNEDRVVAITAHLHCTCRSCTLKAHTHIWELKKKIKYNYLPCILINARTFANKGN